ncbi:rRNA-processing protein cgr1 [Paecilomyces lecythidis]|uniref:rRNA-processing protein n=1 Tax=Paecilomyces lecythidis TaxID=3004212 RepID=A0ABR3Y6N5_9EURO
MSAPATTPVTNATKAMGMKKNGTYIFPPSSFILDAVSEGPSRQELAWQQEALPAHFRPNLAHIQKIKQRRAEKEEKARYEKMAEKMHHKRVERLKRREKRNKLLNS